MSVLDIMHGMSATPLYRVWHGMLERCEYSKHKAWQNYGGRGIKVCHRWHNFRLFYEDFGKYYKPGLTIERKNTNGNYSPDNCVWATHREQGVNRTDNTVIPTPWGPLIIRDAAEKAGLSYTALQYRIRKEWSMDKMFMPRSRGPEFERVFLSTPYGQLTTHQLAVRLGISVNRVYYMRKMGRLHELF